MAPQVKIYAPAGTEYDITARLINDFPGFSESLEAETCVFTPGEMSFEAKNEDGYFTTLFAAADPNDRFNETTGVGAWAIKVWKNSVLRWVGNIDVESIGYDAKHLSCSFNCFGRLQRLERYNAAKVKRDLPDGTDADVLEFTSERGRRVMDFSGTSEGQAQYNLLEVGDVIHVQKAHPVTGKFTEQDVTVKTKLGGYQLKTKERLKAAYTDGIVKTPFYRNQTLTFLVNALLDHATVPGASQSINTPYSASVVEYAEFTDKNVGEALAELCKAYGAKLFADPTAYYFQDRATDLTGDSPKNITSLLCEGSLQLLYESFYDRIVLRGRSPVKDKEKIIRVGNLTYPKREMEISTDYLFDATLLQTRAEDLFDLWGYRRNAYSAEVEDDLTAYKMGQTVTISGTAYWVIGYQEPAREHENITLTLLAKTGTAPGAGEVDLEADADDDPPEPPTIVACTKTYADWPTMKAEYPSKDHPRILIEQGSYKDDAGDIHAYYRKYRMYFLVMQWPYGDYHGKLDAFHIVVFKDGEDPEDAPEGAHWQFNISDPVPKTDSAHGANEYYWRHIRVRVDQIPPYQTYRVAAWAVFEDGRKSEWSDDIEVGSEGDDSTLPVPVIDSISAEKRKVTVSFTIPDSPSGSRAHVGWYQVFKSVGTTAVGNPDTSPANWKKVADVACDDDIDQGRYTFEFTGSFTNAEQRYFTIRTCFRDDKSIKGTFCTPQSAIDGGTNTVASVTAPTSANFVGMVIDDDSQTNKTEMTFDLQLFFESTYQANKDRIEVLLKKSLDGGVTYTKTLPLAQCDLVAGDTSCLLNFRRLVKKGQWVKLVKTVVWNGDAARVQNWGVVCQITKQPLAISSASVSPATGQTTSQNFTFGVVATGGTGTYGYQWVFDSAVTYVSGNANSQSPVVRFGSQGAHWGKCTVTDQSSPAQSVVTNQLVCTIVQGGGSLSVNLIPSATSGTSPLSIVLNAYATGGTGVYTWYTFTWDTSQQGSASSSANATLRNVEGLVTGKSKAITCMCKVEDSAGNTGIGICIVTVAPPVIQYWMQGAYNQWSVAINNGNGNGWTSSSGTSDLSEAIDGSLGTYVKCSIPAGESSKILFIYGMTSLPSLPSNAVITMAYVSFMADGRDSANSGLVLNIETKWTQFTRNSEDVGIRMNKAEDWEDIAQQVFGAPWQPRLVGSTGPDGPQIDPTQSGQWALTDFTTQQYFGFKIKVKNAGSVTKVARFYGCRAFVLYYLN